MRSHIHYKCVRLHKYCLKCEIIIIEAELVVPKDIAQTGASMASVANSFTASINLIHLVAQADFQGGNINQDLAATNNIIGAPGKATKQSQQIPINVNINPKVLIQFIEVATATYGVNLGPLPPFFQKVLDLPGTRTSIPRSRSILPVAQHGSNEFNAD